MGRKQHHNAAALFAEPGRSKGHMNRIVVGVDGSPSAAAALWWAVEEARLRGATLDVVVAWEPPAGLAPGDDGTPDARRLAHDLEESAETTLDTAVQALGSAADDVAMEQTVIRGSPAKALLDIARHADLLVVGSTGLGELRRAVLGSVGSVSGRCVASASCPVVLINARRAAPQHRRGGPLRTSTTVTND